MLTKKRIISYVLSIILAVCILILVFALDLNFTVLSKTNFKRKAASVNYYNRIYDIIMNLCEDDTMQSGFDSSILNNVISAKDVEEDVNRVINKVYDNWDFIIDTSKQRAALDSNIEQFIVNNGYQVDDEIRADIRVYEDTIEDIYVKTISYSNEDINDISAQLKKLKRLSGVIIGAMLILGAVIAVTIFKLNKPSIGISMMAAGAILIFVKVNSGISIAINNILILNRPLSDLISAVINQVLQHMFIVGIMLFVAGLIWTIIFEIRKNYTKILLLDEHSCIIR